jgi:hypothetical protein
LNFLLYTFNDFFSYNNSKKLVFTMKKTRNINWGIYRHPEFLQSLKISVNELKFIRMFLKRGTIELVNEILRERKSKQYNINKEDFPNKFYKLEKIKT